MLSRYMTRRLLSCSSSSSSSSLRGSFPSSSLTRSRTTTTTNHNNGLSARGALSLCCIGGFTTMFFSSLPTPQNPHVAIQDKLLFTPGPLTTSFPTKEAMLHDLGSRDSAFVQVIVDVREGLLKASGLSKDEWTTIIMQGSGTFGVESVVSSVVDKTKGKLLVVINGAYGHRIVSICKAHGIEFVAVECAENEQPSIAAIERAIDDNQGNPVTHVACIHSETTSGIVNNVEAIGQALKQKNKDISFIVDAMSSLGGIPLDAERGCIDYVVSSSNKCYEGVPGFSFVLARKTALDASNGRADTVSLNIHAQVDGLDKTGQFRFTPPTHALLAFRQALREFFDEGGVHARAQRYHNNQKCLIQGVQKLGFEIYLDAENLGHIITSIKFPTDANWDFNRFYNLLNDRNFVIYPGKVSNADCFRIGHIGRLTVQDTENLLVAIDAVCKEMKTAKYFAA